MKNIRTAILAVCIGTISSFMLQAQSTNTAEGTFSFSSNNNGFDDSAFGVGTLNQNRNGAENSAFGAVALYSNTNSSYNSAFGAGALYSNISGNNNTACGAESLFYNYNGSDNAALGGWSLFSNIMGYQDTATGRNALYSNTAGFQNTASGYDALYSNTYGDQNTASGYVALGSNTYGNYNTAYGAFALANTTTGNYNVGIGYAAGYYNSAGASNNIDIGSWGSAGDNGTIRIGSGGQTSAFVAGVNGTTTGVGDAVPVVIDSNGQLGTASSSIRFKEDVHDMAAASDGLMRLRPVTYRYKQPYADGSKPIDYGLIAEEVAEIYPDLVVKNAAGQIQTVQYQKLTPMLLNEVQKEHRQLEEQAKTIDLLEKRLAALEAAQPFANAGTQLAEK
jgi:hypothetical protein